MWAGPKVDLGQKRGHPDLSTKSTYTSNLTTQELLESNFVMDLQTPKPQGVNKNKTLRGLTQKKSKAGCNMVGKQNNACGA